MFCKTDANLQIQRKSKNNRIIFKKYSSLINTADIIRFSISPDLEIDGSVIRPGEAASRTVHSQADPELFTSLWRDQKIPN